MQIYKAILFFFFTQFIFAQDSQYNNQDSQFFSDVPLNSFSENINLELLERKNLFKLNFSVVKFPAASLQYERLLTKRIAFGAGFEYSAKQNFTLIKILSQRLNDQEFTRNQLNNIRYTSFSISPEVKLYLGKQSYQGFYIAPFLRYSFFDVKLPVQFQTELLNDVYQQVQFKGDLKSLTVGLSLGAQWKIAENFYIDWLIVGPHFGGANNQLSLKRHLNEEEQSAISKSLELIKNGLKSINQTSEINFDYQVHENGGEIKFKNPWIGLRMEVGIGYRF